MKSSVCCFLGRPSDGGGEGVGELASERLPYLSMAKVRRFDLTPTKDGSTRMADVEMMAEHPASSIRLCLIGGERGGAVAGPDFLLVGGTDDGFPHEITQTPSFCCLRTSSERPKPSILSLCSPSSHTSRALFDRRLVVRVGVVEGSFV